MLEQAIDTETSNGMSMLDLGKMMALHLRQSRRDRDFARSGSGPEFVDPIWTPADSDSQDREGQDIPGDWQMPAGGRAVGRHLVVCGGQTEKFCRIRAACGTKIVVRL